MTRPLDPAFCITGASPGGLAVAIGAAAMGARVVLIEESKLGVERVAAGDVPVKALVGAARRAEAIRTCGLFGIKPPKTGAGFAEANDDVRRVVEAVAPNVTKERGAGLVFR